MKQRITVEQLNELTDGQKEKLREWWKPNIGDPFIDQRGKKLFVAEIVEHVSGLQIRFVSVPVTYPYQSRDENSYSLIHKSRCLPLLSIGQMIEFLTDQSRKDSDEKTFPLYLIDTSLETWGSKDMCDELWELVKRELGE